MIKEFETFLHQLLIALHTQVMKLWPHKYVRSIAEIKLHLMSSALNFCMKIFENLGQQRVAWSFVIRGHFLVGLEQKS